jgi:hypothetical protein
VQAIDWITAIGDAIDKMPVDDLFARYDRAVASGKHKKYAMLEKIITRENAMTSEKFLQDVAYRYQIKVQAEDYISIEDIYEDDPQYRQFLKFTTDLLYKFKKKFGVDDNRMMDMFISSLKKEF